MSLAFRLFGGVSVTADGRAISGAATQPRRLAVLAILAEACPAPVTRERVFGLLWPEQDEAGARRLLAQALYELRRELGPIITSASGRDLTLDAAALDIDLVGFRRAVQAGDVDVAAALHRGPFLDGFHIRDAGEFERWAATVRDSAERDLRRTMDSAITRLVGEGLLKDAARWAERLLDATPHDSSTVLRAIELFERVGDPGAAARVAATYERRMREDLELPPDADVVRRIARIGQVAPTARAAALELPSVRASETSNESLAGIDANAPHAPISTDAWAAPGASSTPAVRSTPAAALGVLTPAAPVARPFERRSRRTALMASAIGMSALCLSALAGVRTARTPSAARAVVSIARFDAHGDTAAGRIASMVQPMVVANLHDAGGAQVHAMVDSGRDSGREESGEVDHSSRTLRGVVVAVSRDSVRIDATLTPRAPGADELRASVVGRADDVVRLAERLSLELLPELYADLNPAARRDVVRGVRNVAAARAYLDGESALQRAAFDTAYDALRAATKADSDNAFLWYRRAVAAEEMHHIDDADNSAAIADAGRASLPAREQQLVHAYEVWRAGDTRLADSLYREILRARPSDAEAWFQFAEVSYHGGTLIGRPLDAARDAWRRAVALDSNSFPALMHAIRLEARSGDAVSLGALLRRAERVNAREPYLSEARAIAAAAGNRTSLGADDLRRLDELPDASLHFVHAITASFVERPDLAWYAATRLVEPRRPDAVRAEGYAALANLAMTRGQTRLASAMLDSLGARNAVDASWWRSSFATLPFLAPDPSLESRASRELSLAPSRPTAAPLYLELSVNASVASIVHRYEAALLASGSSQRDDRRLGCERLLPGAPRDLCTDLEHGLEATMLERQGAHAAALRQLEAMSMRVPYQLAGRSTYFARTRERFMRAQLLERVGRLEEAYDWYASVPYTSRLDYVYLAPSHLGRARVRERQGDRAGAAAHYARALTLLAVADSGAGALRREALEGAGRMGR